MRNGPNTRSMIFTIFGDYIRHDKHDIWIGSLIKLLKEFGHNEQSVRAAVSRMYKQGWLESQKNGNRSFYRLSPRGKARMEEAGKRIFKLSPDQWDGKWRMFFYSIPEGKRNVREDLKKELSWSGFGALSPNNWLTPNNLIKEAEYLIEKYELADYVHLFTAQYEGAGENKSLVEACWDLSEINEKYTLFIDIYNKKFKEARVKSNNGNITLAECFVEKTLLVHEYRKFLFIDPGLPAELLPEKWKGHAAAALFSEYYKYLEGPAVAFYEQIFNEGNVLKEKW
ncbi:phenylacetic acid degradation operon negative regulatory protein PaaX [Lederbergia citrea]|uniref:Phenylacetic acid degradation operon negative regulatory protein PaaX n=1 Tax=Lederbergia citrea TaxID=2833581 RepID=A0A942Z342_9BACI|nr:phenylacetic acid degradation operon negative regulatory protein PaaX [Lederbergia citrea]MBS4204243.1 phenylacetic acid degradation operon negative regulatory protein PaaX [Lederbergia citrea]MBS4221172.1 phenylacetic acid degradation operon negative regulatory protein PaaX [Lederbergia citrea]